MDSGLPLALVKRLLAVSVDPTLILDVGNCTWEKKTKTLTTPNDAENDANLELEKAAWYNNGFGMKMGKQMAEDVSKKQHHLV